MPRAPLPFDVSFKHVAGNASPGFQLLRRVPAADGRHVYLAAAERPVRRDHKIDPDMVRWVKNHVELTVHDGEGRLITGLPADRLIPSSHGDVPMIAAVVPAIGGERHAR